MNSPAASWARDREADERPRLHVGFYSPGLPESGQTNGIVTYTGIMRDALRAQGHQVTIVTTSHIEHANGQIVPLPKPNSTLRKMQVALERTRRDDGSSPWVRYHIMAACRAARQAGCDLLEIEESHGWAARAIRFGLPIVMRLHGPHLYVRQPPETPAERRAGDLREAAERDAFMRVSAVTSPSRKMLEDLVCRFNLRLPLSRVIPNPMPVGTELWDVRRADHEQILCVGRFDRTKGADVIVKAFAQACEIRPLKLVLAGPDLGVSDEAGKRRHFEQFVQEECSPEVRARISFIGPQPPERINALRLQSGMACSGSRHETFAYSITEAMAVGMPVLTSATFGGLELIRDGIEGRVVTIGDIAAMRDAMLQMTANPEALRDMGRAALKRAQNLLSPDNIARETARLYGETIARSRIRRRLDR